MTKQQIAIWQEMPNKYDYGLFRSACRARGTEVPPQSEWQLEVQMLIKCMTEYPGEQLVNSFPRFCAKYNIKTASEIIAGNEQSRGLGDTVAKITHATGLDKLAELYTHVTGKDCGCQSRQEALNKLFPYGIQEER